MPQNPPIETAVPEPPVIEHICERDRVVARRLDDSRAEQRLAEIGDDEREEACEEPQGECEAQQRAPGDGARRLHTVGENAPAARED